MALSFSTAALRSVGATAVTVRSASLAARASVRTFAADASDDDGAVDDVQAMIAETVASHPVVVYMKGVPEAPQCGFSSQVVQILNLVGVSEFKAVDVLADDKVRAGIKEFTEWPTVPQVFVGGEFVGGRDIVLNLLQEDKLVDILKGAGVEAVSPV